MSDTSYLAQSSWHTLVSTILDFPCPLACSGTQESVFLAFYCDIFVICYLKVSDGAIYVDDAS